MIKEVSKLTYK